MMTLRDVQEKGVGVGGSRMCAINVVRASGNEFLDENDLSAMSLERRFVRCHKFQTAWIQVSEL